MNDGIIGEIRYLTKKQEKDKRHYLKHKERIKARQRALRKAAPDRFRETEKRYRDSHKEERNERERFFTRRRNLRNKYGITIEQYDEMFKA